MAATLPTIDTGRTSATRAGGKAWEGEGRDAACADAPARLESLSRLLRATGALALLAAASSFMLQHWDSGGDVWRYYALLAHTGLLGALGFVWGLRANDAKGARTFLALAAGLVPAHFCILGGLVYSRFSWDGPAVPVARYATWIAPDAASALLAVGLSVGVLALVTSVAFVALARRRAAVLGAAYVAGNAMLLVPTRDPTAVAALAGLVITALVALELRVARREPSLRTLEGGFVRAMLFAPPLIALVRSVLHYELSSLHVAVSSGVVALLCSAGAGERRVPAPARTLLRGAALLALGAASAFATAALGSGLDLPDSALLPIGGLGFAAAATALSLSAGREAWGAAYRRVAAWVLLAAMALDLGLFPGVVAAVACLVTAIVAMSYGFLTRRRAIFLAGVAGAGLSLLTHLRAAIDLYAFANWGSLALVGVGVILAATLVERRGVAWAEGFAALRQRLAAWE